MRIVSLVPAATDWLMAFGADNDLVARSHLCRGEAGIPIVTREDQNLPSDAPSIAHAPATSHSVCLIDEAYVMDLRPDLVIVEDESRVSSLSGDSLANVLSRMRPEIEVFSFAPRTMKQVLDRALALGNTIGRFSAAMACIAKGEERIRRLRTRIGAQRDGSIRNGDAPRAVCIECVDPLVAAGRWVPDLIRLAGGDPVITAARDKSTAITMDDLGRCGADVVFVAARGRPVEQAAEDSRHVAMGTSSAWLVDGSRFATTPGPALYRTIELFAAALHAEAEVAFGRDELRPLAVALPA